MRGMAGMGCLALALLGCAGDDGGDDDGAGTSPTGTADGSDDGGPAEDDGVDDGGDDGGLTSTGTDDSPTTDAGAPTGSDDGLDSTGDDATTGEPTGSAGCGLAEPPSGSFTLQIQGMAGEVLVSVPPGYDPETPYPLGFGFHGRNRTGPNCHDGDCAGFQDAMGNDAVLVYMTSMGGTGWEGDGERELNVEFFQAVLDHMTQGACIDESRIFVAGTSSGAHFTNVLGCRFGDILLAISPVAGYLPETECVGNPAALVIHGVDDGSFDAGVTARDFWAEHNGCDIETVPTISEVHDAVVAEPESHGCVEYQGCDAGNPVVWCEHSEGGYDGSTHGWPLFGGDRIWEFVQAL